MKVRFVLVATFPKDFQEEPGFTGPIKNFCGVRIERQVSTSGWKYKIKRGALESVNPIHVNGASSQLERTRTTLFVCEDDFCNSWGQENWPLPPIITPRRKRDTENLQCVVCDADSDAENLDCFNNAANANTQSCSAG